MLSFSIELIIYFIIIKSMSFSLFHYYFFEKKTGVN